MYMRSGYRFRTSQPLSVICVCHAAGRTVEQARLSQVSDRPGYAVGENQLPR